MNAAGPHTNAEDELQHSQNAAEGYRAAADEHAQTLKDFWKRFMASGLFVVAALVIILACVAWFLNNSQVKANGIDTSTAGARYTLSSDGTQQGAYDQEAGKADSQTHQAGLDVTDSMNVSATSNLVNLSENDVLGPGSYGQLTFTVTPYADDLGDVQIDISREFKGKQGAVSEAVKALASGHVLFFEARDGSGYYESPILNNELTITKNDFQDASGKTTKPVTKTLYWVWPEYIQNFVYTGKANYYKNLFAADNDSYKTMQNYINANPSSFYSVTSGQTIPSLSSTMSSADLATCATAYNKADDEIGNAVEYFQVRLTANEVTNL